MDKLVGSICKEIEMRKDLLGTDEITSIYFGGGTPSLLSVNMLESIFSVIHQNYRIAESPEITLEANPDDVNRTNIAGWKELGINRVSLGIQTFDDDKLAFINRSHHSREAKDSIELIASNFENFNADLIYAIPPANQEIWKNDVTTLLKYDPTHISVYGLTIEEKTVFGKWTQTGKLEEISDSENLHQYQSAIAMLESADYVHYEVSNFSKHSKYSIHNTSYWKGEPYIGIGPGAHSYDRSSRMWNIRNNQKYMKDLQAGILPIEKELLSHTDKQNEYMLTRVRNIWGIDLTDYQSLFDADFLSLNHNLIDQLITDGYAVIENNHFLLTKKGWFLADEISSRLMI